MVYNNPTRTNNLTFCCKENKRYLFFSLLLLYSFKRNSYWLENFFIFIYFSLRLIQLKPNGQPITPTTGEGTSSAQPHVQADEADGDDDDITK